MRALLILLISTLLLTANDKIALVIGNKNYTNQTGLKNPVRDAKLLKETLKGLGFTVIEVYNANVDTISNKLADFASKANHAKVAVIYYAGHGVGVDGKNYLIPLNATNLSRATLPKKLISLDELQEAVSGAKGFGVVLFDACRNSFFSGKIRGLSGNRASRALVLPQASSKNTLVSFSTQAGKLAKDDVGSANHSPYAIALSEKLKLKKDIRLVMGGVKERVEKLTNYEQEPISRSSLGENSFCLTGCEYTPPTGGYTPQTEGKWNPLIYRGKRSYSKNSTNTVKDNYTGLIWQKKDDGVKRNWKEAKRYCSNLSLDGSSDWRLPTMEELYYLGDMTKFKPAIDSNYFDIENSYYWSATAYKNDSSFAWLVYFKHGNDRWDGKSLKGLALCVR